MERTRRPLSAVVIALNEERRIVPCLESLSFADEIVVVDSGSTDGTVAAARSFTDKVRAVPWKGFGPQKQAAGDLASHDVIFNIDCDERMTPELAGEIDSLLRGESLAAGQRRLAQPGRAIEENVLQRLAAFFGRSDGDRELVLGVLLADALAQPLRPKRDIQGLFLRAP